MGLNVERIFLITFYVYVWIAYRGLAGEVLGGAGGGAADVEGAGGDGFGSDFYAHRGEVAHGIGAVGFEGEGGGYFTGLLVD